MEIHCRVLWEFDKRKKMLVCSFLVGFWGRLVHVWGKVVLEFISPTLKIVVLFFYHKDAYLDNDSSLP